MQFVDLHAQHLALKKELDAAIKQVVRQSSFVRGPFVDEFEERYAQLSGARHCVSCANGTDALYIALRALGLEAGDEVITTAHSWISSSETISQAGGRVVFCDTEEDYFCIDPSLIESRINDKTRGIIVVHLFGQPADMDPIMDIARSHGLWIIEDCAQAHLAEYKGRQVGTMGDVGTFSFYPGKNLGAMGDAGCLISNRDDVAEFSRLFACHGGKNNHVMEGINSRMDGLQAAVLNVKMTMLEEWTETRRQLAARFDDRLAELKDIVTPAMREHGKHVFHLYVIRNTRRDDLKAFLNRESIPTIINYPRALPFYRAYDYLGHAPTDFPVARRHANEILSLPLHPYLSASDQDRVVDAIERYLSAA